MKHKENVKMWVNLLLQWHFHIIKWSVRALELSSVEHLLELLEWTVNCKGAPQGTVLSPLLFTQTPKRKFISATNFETYLNIVFCWLPFTKIAQNRCRWSFYQLHVATSFIQTACIGVYWHHVYVGYCII